MAERLQQVDVEQERKRERLAELHRQTLTEEERLADTMRDVAGRKVRKTACLSTYHDVLACLCTVTMVLFMGFLSPLKSRLQNST